MNWLMECLFQSEAPGDGDDTTTVATAQGRDSDVEEIAKGQTRAGPSQEDAEAELDGERAEV
jgi:hypothetical protein